MNSTPTTLPYWFNASSKLALPIVFIPPYGYRTDCDPPERFRIDGQADNYSLETIQDLQDRRKQLGLAPIQIHINLQNLKKQTTSIFDRTQKTS